MDDGDLSSKQQQVLEALLSGQSITAAADAAGASRRAVHNWLSNHTAFAAAYAQGRAALAHEANARLTGLVDRAVRRVESEIKYGNAHAAFTLLKGLGLLDGTALKPASDPPAARAPIPSAPIPAIPECAQKCTLSQTPESE